MNQVNWFDRKFDFSFQQNIFPSLLERLEGTPLRLEYKISGISNHKLTIRVEGKWSILENIGHLIDLESLWQGRLQDVLNEEKYLRTTDLTNAQVDKANFNSTEVLHLLNMFRDTRHQTMIQLVNLTEVQIFKSALHPRLEQPMRTMDLFLFVAEHDDHHLARISEINRAVP